VLAISPNTVVAYSLTISFDDQRVGMNVPEYAGLVFCGACTG
jgi:hypothetical protein